MPTFQKVWKTLEVPQLHFFNRFVSVPVALQRRVPANLTVLKTVEMPQVQFNFGGVLVIMHRQIPVSVAPISCASHASSF